MIRLIAFLHVLIFSSRVCGAKLPAWLVAEPVPGDRYEAVAFIEGELRLHVEELSFSWGYSRDSVEDILAEKNSDYLYLLTCAACLNPYAARSYIARVLAGDFHQFEGSIPARESKMLILAAVDLARFAPGYLNSGPEAPDVGILVARNVGRSAVNGESLFPAYISRFLLYERLKDLEPGAEELRDLANGYLRGEVEVKTPYLSDLFMNVGVQRSDSDGDGVPDSRDTNPIQASRTTSPTPAEQVCALSVGLKIYLEKVEGVVVLTSPEPLGFEIPVPAGVTILNLIASDFDQLSSTSTGRGYCQIHLENTASILSHDPVFSARGVSPQMSAVFGPNGDEARVAVSRPQGDHTWINVFDFRRKGATWVLTEAYERGPRLLPLASLYLTSQQLWWLGRP